MGLFLAGLSMLLLTGANATGAPEYRMIALFFLAGAAIYVGTGIFLGGWEILVLGAAGFLAFGGIGTLLGLWIGYSIFTVRRYDPLRPLRNEDGVPSLSRIFTEQTQTALGALSHLIAAIILMTGLPWGLSLLHDWRWIDLEDWRPVAEAVRPYWPAINYLDPLGDHAVIFAHAYRVPPEHAGPILVICLMVALITLGASIPILRYANRLLPVTYLRYRKRARRRDDLDVMPALMLIVAPFLAALFLWLLYKTGGLTLNNSRRNSSPAWGFLFYMTTVLFPLGIGLCAIYTKQYWRYGNNTPRFFADLDRCCQAYGIAEPSPADREAIEALVTGPATLPVGAHLYRVDVVQRGPYSARILVCIGLGAIILPYVASFFLPWMQIFALVSFAACLGFVVYRIASAKLWEAAIGAAIGALILGGIGAGMGTWLGYVIAEARRYDPRRMMGMSHDGKLHIHFDRALLVLPVLTVSLLAVLPESLFVLAQWDMFDPALLQPFYQPLTEIVPGISQLGQGWYFGQIATYIYVDYYELCPAIAVTCLWVAVCTLMATGWHVVTHRGLYRLAYRMFKLPIFETSGRGAVITFVPYILAGFWFFLYGVAAKGLTADDEGITRWGSSWALFFLAFFYGALHFIHGTVYWRYFRKPAAFERDLEVMTERLQDSYKDSGPQSAER